MPAYQIVPHAHHLINTDNDTDVAVTEYDGTDCDDPASHHLLNARYTFHLLLTNLLYLFFTYLLDYNLHIHYLRTNALYQ
jgi:hypothetical protein